MKFLEDSILVWLKIKKKMILCSVFSETKRERCNLQEARDVEPRPLRGTSLGLDTTTEEVAIWVARDLSPGVTGI